MLLAFVAHAVPAVHCVIPYDVIYIIVRTSTPTFILLFGMMITVVYAPYGHRHGNRALTILSVSRAAQCWALYVCNVVVLFLTQNYSVQYSALRVMFLGSTPYTDILRFYSVLFLLTPLLVLVPRKIPVWMCVIAFAAVHLFYPQIKAVPPAPTLFNRPIPQRIADIFLGLGNVPVLAGPSVLHSLVLVFSGMAMGRWAQGSRRALWPVTFLFVTMGAWSLIMKATPTVTIDRLSGMELRNLNHPAYIFLIGGLSVTTIWLFTKAVDAGLRVPRPLLVFGRRSLFSFGFGNIVITVWPSIFTANLGPLFSMALLLAVLFALVSAYDVLIDRGQKARLAGETPNLLYRFATEAKAQTVRAASRLVGIIAGSIGSLELWDLHKGRRRKTRSGSAR